MFFFAFVANAKEPLTADTAQVKILYVVDGDTYAFKYKKEIYKIRLLGIDCFEIHSGKRLNKQAAKAGIKPKTALKHGYAAKKLADSLLTGKTVTIIRDKQEKNFDVYNRLLRYVWVDGVDIEIILLKRKLALKYAPLR